MRISLLISLLVAWHTPSSHSHVMSAQGQLSDESLCQTCMTVMRIASDYLCDFEFQAWITDSVEATVCDALSAEHDDCKQVR